MYTVLWLISSKSSDQFHVGKSIKVTLNPNCEGIVYSVRKCMLTCRYIKRKIIYQTFLIWKIRSIKKWNKSKAVIKRPRSTSIDKCSSPTPHPNTNPIKFMTTM